MCLNACTAITRFPHATPVDSPTRHKSIPPRDTSRFPRATPVDSPARWTRPATARACGLRVKRRQLTRVTAGGHARGDAERAGAAAGGLLSLVWRQGCGPNSSCGPAALWSNEVLRHCGLAVCAVGLLPAPESPRPCAGGALPAAAEGQAWRLV